MRKVENRFVETAMMKICDGYCRFPYDSGLSQDQFDEKCSHCFIRSVFVNFVSYPPLGFSKSKLEVINHE